MRYAMQPFCNIFLNIEKILLYEVFSLPSAPDKEKQKAFFMYSNLKS